jgi:XTP/dITP diphosphohydrolase
MPDQVLYFATGNGAKLAQLRWITRHLRGDDVRVLSARAHFGGAARYDEVGATECAIARRGALEVAKRLGVAVLTEDTGLHVVALDGCPGIRAGRYLKAHGRAGLLCELEDKDDRRAEIVSAVAYATPEGTCATYEHRVPGRITCRERWTPGLPDWIAPAENNVFGGGYNAVFVPTGEERTLAQIPPHEALGWGYREPNFIALLRALGHLAS